MSILLPLNFAIVLMAHFGGGDLLPLTVIGSHWFVASLILVMALILSGKACLIGFVLSDWI